MPRMRALTLLELLIALTVVAVLAGVLFVAAGRAKERAHAACCLHNLKQWGTATLLYTADHRDFLPPDGKSAPLDADTNSGWYIQLPETMGLPRYHDMPWRKDPTVNPGPSIWICPSNLRRSNSNNLFHYCLNEHVNGTGWSNRPVQLSSLRQPAQTVWLFDNGGLAAVAQQNNVHTNLHRRGAQFVFLDAHAARFPSSAYWDFKTRKGRTDNSDLLWIP